MTHSFYAGMGGFMFDEDLKDSPIFKRKEDETPPLRLTAQGILRLARLNRLPAISKESIQDKSKADWLAKLFTIWQTGWLLVDCIARKAAHLPLHFLSSIP